MPVRSLSFHGAYRCRESGACCTAGWPIPIEADRLEAAEGAAADGRMEVDAGLPMVFIREPDASCRLPAADQRPAVLATRDGACVFHRSTPAERCGLHRALGPAALPLACRQFPRVSLIDPRGVSVTLSHFCPTAASLLRYPGRAAIVLDGPAFPPSGEYVGLDARTSLPPLLRPGLLMDWEAWWAWEARSVAVIARAATTRDALDALAVAVEKTRSWRPREVPLLDRVNAVFDDLESACAARFRNDGAAAVRARRVAEVIAAVPEDLRAMVPSPTGSAPGAATRRNFLLAHAFANWTGYLGQGLRTWLRSLETADALLHIGADVRSADLLLRHLTDPFALADRWSEAEAEAA